MRVCRSLLPLLLFGCSSSPATPADAAVPLDMSVAAPTTLAPAQTLTSCLATDGAYVYWSDGTPQIWKVPVGGGAVMGVVAGGDKNTCVAVDSNAVYYVEGDKIMKSPSAGGAIIVASGQNVLGHIAVSGGYIYWITDTYGNVDAYNGKNAIVRVPTSANAATTTEVVSAEVMGTPGGLAVDDTNVYYSDSTGVWARALAQPATAISFGQSTLHGNALAVGGGHLAMTEIMAVGSGDVAVFRTDGMMRLVVSPSLAKLLAVDDRGVYVNDNNALVRLALDGSGATVLATQPPRAVALAGGTIFFTDGTAIYSLPE